jgi:hypothetical protein
MGRMGVRRLDRDEVQRALAALSISAQPGGEDDGLLQMIRRLNMG